MAVEASATLSLEGIGCLSSDQGGAVGAVEDGRRIFWFLVASELRRYGQPSLSTSVHLLRGVG